MTDHPINLLKGPGAATASRVDADGTVHAPSFQMGFSSIASREARDDYVAQYAQSAEMPPVGSEAARLRQWADETIILPLLAKQRERWADLVDVTPDDVEGVYVEVFTPTADVGAGDDGRVLVNLHGGGFTVGGRTEGRLESIPIAALARTKVVSVDYRMAPEHAFPAASEDVATVYRSLLTEYEPERIGIYGGSAGGILAAQAVAWFVEEGLPLPGAIGMFGGSGRSVFAGDSCSLAYHLHGERTYAPDAGLEVLPYFAGADVESPLVAPMLWPELLAQFPPSLLITGGRAFEMSSVIDAHNRLILAGARSRLHVWDGVGHCFYLDPDLPESREAERIMVDFFAETLGRGQAAPTTSPADRRAT